jgi:uncharacterized alkaline shock family protein YloU
MNEKPAGSNTKEFDIGRVEISSRAIATIVANAVCQCYGVVGMAPRNLRDSVVQVLKTEDQYKGIEVQISPSEITIDLYVVIEYGTRIATVARNIMESVKYAVEHAVGLPVAAVNVHIQGLRVTDQRRDGRHAGGRANDSAGV